MSRTANFSIHAYHFDLITRGAKLLLFSNIKSHVSDNVMHLTGTNPGKLIPLHNFQHISADEFHEIPLGHFLRRVVIFLDRKPFSNPQPHKDLPRHWMVFREQAAVQEAVPEITWQVMVAQIEYSLDIVIFPQLALEMIVHQIPGMLCWLFRG
jgi:hypothetical protein